MLERKLIIGNIQRVANLEDAAESMTQMQGANRFIALNVPVRVWSLQLPSSLGVVNVGRWLKAQRMGGNTLVVIFANTLKATQKPLFLKEMQGAMCNWPIC